MTRKNYNLVVFPYLLSCIDSSGYGMELNTEKEKLQFIADTFKSEYGWQAERLGYTKAFNEWLQGLPSCYNVDFENYRIIELAKEWGSLPINATDKQEDKILDGWFAFITHKTFQLMKKNKVLPY